MVTTSVIDTISEMTKDPWNEDIVIYEEETILTDDQPGDIVVYEEETILPDKQTVTNKRPGDVVVYEEETILPDKQTVTNKRPGDIVVYEEEPSETQSLKEQNSHEQTNKQLKQYQFCCVVCESLGLKDDEIFDLCKSRQTRQTSFTCFYFGCNISHVTT